MNQPEKTRLLEQMAAIPAMERGKLSRYVFKERSHTASPHFKLQRWQEGKNHTRHVSADELPAVQSVLPGHAQYRELTEQYAELVIQETRQNIAVWKAPTSRSTSKPSVIWSRPAALLFRRDKFNV